MKFQLVQLQQASQVLLTNWWAVAAMWWGIMHRLGRENRQNSVSVSCGWRLQIKTVSDAEFSTVFIATEKHETFKKNDKFSIEIYRCVQIHNPVTFGSRPFESRFLH
jgi:hypothetical protein